MKIQKSAISTVPGAGIAGGVWMQMNGCGCAPNRAAKAIAIPGNWVTSETTLLTGRRQCGFDFHGRPLSAGAELAFAIAVRKLLGECGSLSAQPLPRLPEGLSQLSCRNLWERSENEPIECIGIKVCAAHVARQA